MTIKQFIEKAIEGGYLFKIGGRKILPNASHLSAIPFEIIALDPLAWQAVGKVEKWEMEATVVRWLRQSSGELEKNVIGYQWENKWHDMIDALAEGKSLEDYIKTL